MPGISGSLLLSRLHDKSECPYVAEPHTQCTDLRARSVPRSQRAFRAQRTAQAAAPCAVCRYFGEFGLLTGSPALAVHWVCTRRALVHRRARAQRTDAADQRSNAAKQPALSWVDFAEVPFVVTSGRSL